MFSRESALKMQVVRQAATLAVIFITAFVTLWGFYRFRQAPRPRGYEMSESLSAFIQDGVQYRHAHGLMLTRVIPLLAYALPKSYVYGMADIAIDNSVGRTAYIFSNSIPRVSGFTFLPQSWSKPRWDFCSSCFSQFLWRVICGARKARDALPAHSRYFLSCREHDLEAEFRHPPHTSDFSAADCARRGSSVLSRQPQPRVPLRRRSVRSISLRVIAARVSVSLSFSNQAFGGPQQTYRYLLDTNSDWAQGLVDDHDYLARNHITDCWIDYYGPLDPDYYGVPCKVLALYPSKRAGALPLPFEGTLIVSVADFMDTMGPAGNGSVWPAASCAAGRATRRSFPRFPGPF